MPSSKTNLFVHPKPFYLLFSIEIWERFGYYGMQAILVLFMVQRLEFSDILAENTFSAFAALVYAFTCIGGCIGDKLLGARRTLLLGAITLATGYFLLGLNSMKYLYPALGIIIAGNALFKANPSSLLSKLYKTDDPRVDGAFTLYYMAINIGSFISMSITPFVAKKWGWDIAYSLSFIGMLVAISNFIIFHKVLDKIDSEPGLKPMKISYLLFTITISVIIAVTSAYLLKHISTAHLVLYIAMGIVGLFFIREIIVANNAERIKLMVCSALIFESVMFFALYQQMPTSLNLFAVRNTHHFILGIPIEPASFQALNPLWIMIASPLLVMVYTKMGKNGKDLSMPAKFTLGMFLCSLGFLSLTFAGHFFADTNGKIAGNWLILTYGLQSIGELLISGLGLAMITKLAPQRSMGFIMGAWFMSQSIAMIIGGKIAIIAAIPENITTAASSLPIYIGLFEKIGFVTLGVTVVMLIFVPVLKKYATYNYSDT